MGVHIQWKKGEKKRIIRSRYNLLSKCGLVPWWYVLCGARLKIASVQSFPRGRCFQTFQFNFVKFHTSSHVQTEMKAAKQVDCSWTNWSYSWRNSESFPPCKHFEQIFHISLNIKPVFNIHYSPFNPWCAFLERRLKRVPLRSEIWGLQIINCNSAQASSVCIVVEVSFPFPFPSVDMQWLLYVKLKRNTVIHDRTEVDWMKHKIEKQIWESNLFRARVQIDYRPNSDDTNWVLLIINDINSKVSGRN